MAGFRVFWAVLGLTGVVVACGSGSDAAEDETLQRPGGAGSQGGTAGTTGTAECVSTSCECPNGLTSVTECPSEECSCDACPEFDPRSTLPAFEACGGEPFGIWQATKTEINNFDFHLTNGSGVTSTCHGQTDTTAEVEFIVEFDDGGVGRIHYEFPELVASFSDACIQEGLGTSCEYIDEHECELLDCGLCRCTFAGRYFDEEITWSRDGSRLTFVTSDTMDTMDYCVDGGALVQSSEDGNLRYTMQKVYLSGVPTSCAERTAETCNVAGCSLGECAGTGNCGEAYSESSCMQFQDCSWDPDVCKGTANPTCSMADHAGEVPGCQILTGNPTCTGAPEPCDGQQGCAAEGCSVSTGCIGGEHACFAGDDEVPGCTCNAYAECEGTFKCSEIADDLDCVSSGLSGSCAWSSSACVGIPTDCAELSADQCQDTEGCMLQPAP
jgi:hypothetical protein